MIEAGKIVLTIVITIAFLAVIYGVLNFIAILSNFISVTDVLMFAFFALVFVVICMAVYGVIF